MSRTRPGSPKWVRVAFMAALPTRLALTAAVLALAMGVFASETLAAPGDLDPSFNGTGKLVFNQGALTTRFWGRRHSAGRQDRPPGGRERRWGQRLRPHRHAVEPKRDARPGFRNRGNNPDHQPGPHRIQHRYGQRGGDSARRQDPRGRQHVGRGPRLRHRGPTHLRRHPRPLLLPRRYGRIRHQEDRPRHRRERHSPRCERQDPAGRLLGPRAPPSRRPPATTPSSCA